MNLVKKQPVLLCILDGFGINSNNYGNAINSAQTPNLHYLLNKYPHLAIHASGEWVGLPDQQMGNSEVGHIHIGAGRVIYQSLTLINKAITEKTFFSNQAIKNAIIHAKNNHKKLHIIGLLSDGGVHAHINHILAILEYCAHEQFSNVFVHAILDGRDTKADNAKIYLEQLITKMQTLKVGHLASISGRYYAMDRDRRWERLALAYDVMVLAKGISFIDPFQYVSDEYQAKRLDEFVIPAYNKNISGQIETNDSVIFANFRPDRAIQLASALTNSDYQWNQNDQEKTLGKIFFVAMMNYADSVCYDGIAFLPQSISDGLGEWVAKKGLTQLRIAETEKYAHVTYFFDGGLDVEYQNETRILIPSPKVATYDLLPEMSANLITDRLVSLLPNNEFDLIVLNFANPDMVGHTGKLAATIKAINVIDECLGRLYQAINKVNGTLIITADHGNAEIMIDEQGNENKKHTSQPVPLIICRAGLKLTTTGSLANVAPTVLDLMKLEKPEAMTENSLLVN